LVPAINGGRFVGGHLKLAKFILIPSNLKLGGVLLIIFGA